MPTKPCFQDLENLEDIYIYITQADMPSMSATIKKIIELNPEYESPSNDLTQIILEDYGLIGKVLKTVNSIYYNRFGKEITTVTQAVMLLGFITIKELALSMALLDLSHSNNSAILKKLLAQAFISAHLAIQIAEKKNPNNNCMMEEYFLSALFYPLPRILTALYDEKCYLTLADEEIRGIQERQTKVKRFWMRIGQTIGKTWNLPSTIKTNLEFAPQAIKHRWIKDQELIPSIHICTSAIIEQDQDNISTQIKKIEQISGVEISELKTYITTAINKSLICYPTLNNIIKDVKNTFIETTDIDKINKLEDLTKDKNKEDSSKEKELNKSISLIELLTEFTDVIMNPNIALDQTILMSVEILHKGIDLKRVLFCLLTAEKNAMTVRYGIGEKVEKLRNNVIIKYPPKNDKLKKIFKNGMGQYITWNDLPEFTQIQGLENNTIFIFPITISDKTIGCFILELKHDLNQEKLNYIKTIQNLITMAMQKQQR
ncbi:MAG: HDOD domain-containing protein [Desulfobacteraceae bacterium]|nr:HDOD domain-containing protein [Desulfobacteraceae bacterium]